MGKIIYNKGFGFIFKETIAPTITLIEKDAFSITVTFTNNSSQEATISYGLSSPPNDDTVLLASNATSSNITFSGLDDDTTYTIFAVAKGTPKNLVESKIVSIEENTPNQFEQFVDTSGSPGATSPINDLDGNPMVNVEKGIAYYGTVSHTDLFTSDELASAVGVTAGTSQDNQEVWHKYYWNGGIHFWRKPIRFGVSWSDLWEEGAVFGTGTDTSRKGETPTDLTSINQDAEVTKNGVTFAVRLMERGNVDPVELETAEMHNSEYTLILMNLHAATNSGEYSPSPTDGVSYANWTETANFTNDDFVGWKTDFGDNDFTLTGNGSFKRFQETRFNIPSHRISAGYNRMSSAQSDDTAVSVNVIGWFPVLTVKHSSFTYE